MKELTLVGEGGTLLAKQLVDVKGTDIQITFPYPIYYPVVGLSLVEKEKDKVNELNEVERE